MDGPTLYVHTPEWGMESSDSFCLTVKAYMQIAGIKHDTIATDNVYVSPSGELPLLCADGDAVLHGPAILAHIRTHANSSSLASLSDTQIAQTRAFSSLVLVELQYAKLFEYWLRNDGSQAYMHSRVLKQNAWPLNRVLLSLKRKQVESFVRTRYPSLSAEEIYKNAKSAADALSTRLGFKHWYFESGPTELDAVVYGLVHEVLQYSSNSGSGGDELAGILKQHSNLVAHAKRFHAFLAGN